MTDFEFRYRFEPEGVNLFFKSVLIEKFIKIATYKRKDRKDQTLYEIPEIIREPEIRRLMNLKPTQLRSNEKPNLVFLRVVGLGKGYKVLLKGKYSYREVMEYESELIKYVQIIYKDHIKQVITV